MLAASRRIKQLAFAASAVGLLFSGCTSHSISALAVETARGTSAAPTLVSTQTADSPSSPVAVTEEAHDGPFAFSIAVVEVVVNEPDNEVQPQGVFFEIAMYVKNIGSSQQEYVADYQRLVDSKGRVFSPNLRADSSYPKYNEVDINPGNRTSAYLYFDVPKGTKPSQYLLVLHASPHSPGATVILPDEYRDPASIPTG